MGLVPSMYDPVCMECVLSDKQVGPNRASLLFTLFGDGRGRKVRGASFESERETGSGASLEVSAKS